MLAEFDHEADAIVQILVSFVMSEQLRSMHISACAMLQMPVVNNEQIQYVPQLLGYPYCFDGEHDAGLNRRLLATDWRDWAT